MLSQHDIQEKINLSQQQQNLKYSTYYFGSCSNSVSFADCSAQKQIFACAVSTRLLDLRLVLSMHLKISDRQFSSSFSFCFLHRKLILYAGK